MPTYRVRRENVRYDSPVDHRPGLVLLRASRAGLTLQSAQWDNLPQSTFGRLATVLLNLREDPQDAAFVICETREVILDGFPGGRS